MKSPLILKHLTNHDLPVEWTKQLPLGHQFSVIIMTEKTVSEPLKNQLIAIDTPLFCIWRDYDDTQNVETYVRHLRRNRFESRVGKHFFGRSGIHLVISDIVFLDEVLF